jgi:hypothetical protein
MASVEAVMYLFIESISVAIFIRRFPGDERACCCWS